MIGDEKRANMRSSDLAGLQGLRWIRPRRITRRRRIYYDDLVITEDGCVRSEVVRPDGSTIAAQPCSRNQLRYFYGQQRLLNLERRALAAATGVLISLSQESYFDAS